MGKMEHRAKQYLALAGGLTLLWPNLQHSFFRMSLTGQLGQTSLAFYGLSLATITLCTFVFLSTSRAALRLLIKRPLVVGVSSLLALFGGSTLVALPSLGLEGLAFSIPAFASTIAWSCSLCVVFFAWLAALESLMFDLDIRIVVGIAALSGVVGFFLIPVMVYHTAYYRFVAVSCLCASGLIWLASSRRLFALDECEIPSEYVLLSRDFFSLRHWGVLLIAYLLASTLHAVFYAMDADIDLAMYGTPCYGIAGAFGLTFALTMLPQPHTPQKRWPSNAQNTGISMSVGLFAGLLLAMLLFDFGNREASLNFMSAANRCLQILIFISLLMLVYQQRTSSIVVFSLFFLSVEVLSNFICYFLAPAFIDYFHIDVAASITLTSSIIGATLVAVLVFSLIVFGQSDSMRAITFERSATYAQNEGCPSPTTPDRSKTCEQIAKQHGLTNREQDVLFYLSQGYSAKRIAEALYVSYETVRSHTSGIYRKMNIHSKQDLIDEVLTREAKAQE